MSLIKMLHFVGFFFLR